MTQFMEGGKKEPCLNCGKPTPVRNIGDKPFCSRVCRSKYESTVKYFGGRSERINRPKK